MTSRLILAISLLCCSSALWAKTEVLAQAGEVKIIKRNCNVKTDACDYIKTYKGQDKVLISQWNKTARAYQFTPKLIGFKLGATGSAHILTVYDQNNKQQEFFELLKMSPNQKCFVTKQQLDKEHDKVVFYRLPELKPYLSISKKDPKFSEMEQIGYSTFFDESDGSFNFGYDAEEDGEKYFQEIKVENPCSLKPKIIKQGDE
ncbi:MULTISPECIES: hypothetical protein [Acinetobacter]|uniref:hypothetical protein n=1 Tax=Acinetobacter TaxID=469 RepID=UPI0002CDC287|nr:MULTISPECIES: hypothetical protein [Acinetobacter]ENX61284.1 hypothetical protein F885_01684 [Acinetobacter higginsii]MCH7318814.1 hypothetical protein [Acinetobacter higginsii]MCH7379427.1 hypothetical protein [Acinetobacter higginsii]